MPRRSIKSIPHTIRDEIVDLLQNFEVLLHRSNLRERVIALIPVFHKLRDLGCSLIPQEEASSARDRILTYFLKYPQTIIHGDELLVVSGIQDWPRRVRELRREFGWNIVSGVTFDELASDFNFEIEGEKKLRPEEYILLNTQQDRDAAIRWHIANEIRRSSAGSKQKILDFFRRNIGKAITSEEIRYVANDKSEWARRIRELRTEAGWPIITKNTGRPDLPIGVYVLEQDKQYPPHDRNISDSIRNNVLTRDHYQCQECGWTYDKWDKSDPRHLELHHIKHHVSGGNNTESNLIVLCNVCHDIKHQKH